MTFGSPLPLDPVHPWGQYDFVRLALVCDFRAVENSGTAIGVRCRDGVVLGVEKLMLSRMLVKRSNRKIFVVDEHIGIAAAGVAADCRALVGYARDIAKRYRQNFGCPVPPSTLTDQLAYVCHQFTAFGAHRPFGSAVVIAGYDEEAREQQLHMLEPDGTFYKYFGTAIGKGARSAKTEIEKAHTSEKTCREALTELSKILHTVHDSTKDKPFEMEMGWICEESGFKFELVPEHLVEEADRAGKEQVEAANQRPAADDDDEEDEEDDVDAAPAQ